MIGFGDLYSVVVVIIIIVVIIIVVVVVVVVVSVVSIGDPDKNHYSGSGVHEIIAT